MEANAQETDFKLYPLPKRRYMGLFQFPRRRLFTAFIFFVPAVVSMFVFLPLGLLCAMVGLIATMPTGEGYVCDNFANRRATKRLNRLGGYVYSTSIAEGKAVPSGITLVSYNLDEENRFAVTHNAYTGQDIIYILIENWPQVETLDWVDRMGADFDLNQEFLIELTTRNIFASCAMFTVRRTADPSHCAEHIDAHSKGADDLMEALVYMASVSGALTRVIAIPVASPKNATKAIERQRFDDIPAVFVAKAVIAALKAIGISATPPSETELATLLRAIADPSDPLTYQLRAQDKATEAEESKSGFGPTSLQRPLLPPTAQVGQDWLRLGGTYHTVLCTKQFKRTQVAPGYFDALFNGVGLWTSTSLIVHVEPKTKHFAGAKLARSWKIGDAHNKELKGDVMTEKQVKALDEMLKDFDEIDQTEGGMAVYSLAFSISALSVEELDEVANKVMEELAAYWLVVERLDGEAVQLHSFHQCFGLAA